MSSIADYVEKDRQYLQGIIVGSHPIFIKFESIYGLNAHFSINYKEHNFKVYTINRESYLSIDAKTPGYLHDLSVTMYKGDDRKHMSVPLYRGKKSRLDLDKLIAKWEE